MSYLIAQQLDVGARRVPIHPQLVSLARLALLLAPLLSVPAAALGGAAAGTGSSLLLGVICCDR